MSVLDFDVYIGCHSNLESSEKIVAKVYPGFVIPHGEVNESGDYIQHSGTYFIRLDSLAIYFADWFDIVDNKSRIKAKIHLNKKSVFKSFKGEEILKVIDKIKETEIFGELRSFDDLL